MRATKEAGAVEALRQVLDDPDGLADAVAVLRRGVAAADSSGRPMHAGLMSMNWPTSALGQLWHACTILREHRGDGHLDAYVSAGLTGLEANLLTELIVGWEPLAYTASRGWSIEAMQAGTPRSRELGLAANDSQPRPASNCATRSRRRPTTVMQPVIDAIGDDLESLTSSSTHGRSRSSTAVGSRPARSYKRASG
jgi:hypothetical protein